jgi:Spy/CpxP family protein refolding chaperone
MVTALALLSVLVQPVGAAPRVVPAPLVPRPNAPLRRAMEELGLTTAQRRQLAQMRRGRRQEQVQIAPQIRARRLELADLYRAYPLDEARAAALIQQIGQLETQRLRLQLQNQVELRRILTRDQFVRFTQILETGPPPVPPPARLPGS